jgi:hypothetical protein
MNRLSAEGHPNGYERGRHVQNPQQIQATDESRYRHVRVRRRGARWRRRGSVIGADLNMQRGEVFGASHASGT